MEGNDLFASLLNDPDTLQSAIAAATSLLGNTAQDAPPPSSPPMQTTSIDPSADLMRAAMPVLGRIAQSGQTAVSPQKRNLLTALKPFVSEQTAQQIDHGIRLVALAHMASAAMHQLGGMNRETSEEAQHV